MDTEVCIRKTLNIFPRKWSVFCQIYRDNKGVFFWDFRIFWILKKADFGAFDNQKLKEWEFRKQQS